MGKCIDFCVNGLTKVLLCRHEINQTCIKQNGTLLRTSHLKILFLLQQVPVNLLRASRVFVFEPPPGVKANLLRTFSAVPATRMCKVSFVCQNLAEGKYLFWVGTAPGFPRVVENLDISRPGRPWNLIVSPGKLWYFKVIFSTLHVVTANVKARTKLDTVVETSN